MVSVVDSTVFRRYWARLLTLYFPTSMTLKNNCKLLWKNQTFIFNGKFSSGTVAHDGLVITELRSKELSRVQMNLDNVKHGPSLKADHCMKHLYCTETAKTKIMKPYYFDSSIQNISGDFK